MICRTRTRNRVVGTRGHAVVPANAGTHNHRRRLERSRRPASSKSKGRGVWVPAFAGTTLRLQRRQHRIADIGGAVLAAELHRLVSFRISLFGRGPRSFALFWRAPE